MLELSLRFACPYPKDLALFVEQKLKLSIPDFSEVYVVYPLMVLGSEIDNRPNPNVMFLNRL